MGDADIIMGLIKANKELEKQNELLKCCGNCFYFRDHPARCKLENCLNYYVSGIDICDFWKFKITS